MDNNCCRSRDVINQIFKDYADYFIHNYNENDDENISSLKSIFLKAADLVSDSEISDFDAEHVTDAFLYVFKVRLESLCKHVGQSDNINEFVAKSQQAIAELAHGNAIKQYRDLLKAEEVNGEIYVYPIYLTEQPGYELNVNYGCSVKGAELLEAKIGKTEEFNGLLRGNS